MSWTPADRDPRPKRLSHIKYREARTLRLAGALGHCGLVVAGVRQRIAQELSLTLDDWRVLSVLANRDNGISNSDLARRLRRRRQTTHRLCIRLARTGRIRFVTSPRDRRILLLELTPTGAGVLQQAERRYQFWWLTVTQVLPAWQLAQWAERQEALHDLLMRTAGHA